MDLNNGNTSRYRTDDSHARPNPNDDMKEDELEKLLRNQCDFNKIRHVCSSRSFPKRLRPLAWQVLLGVNNRGDPFTDWDGIYNLPEQELVRKQCQKIIDAFGNSEADHIPLISDVEGVITIFCKSRSTEFTEGNGWVDLLQLILTLELSQAQLFHVFNAIVTKYVPNGGRVCDEAGKQFDLFRLLLLYHDPELCSFLDTRKIGPYRYAKEAFNTLFAFNTTLDVTLKLWDAYLLQADPFLIFFMELVILANAREQIFSMKNDSPEDIVNTLKSFPSRLASDDIEDFCQLALHYSSITPQSFRRDYHGPLFGSNFVDAFENVIVHTLLCLPISVQELVNLHQSVPCLKQESGVSYFVVDTRPSRQYTHGHLPRSYNLDASLLVSDPQSFSVSVKKMQEFKGKVDPLAHTCFIGSGREEDDQYLHMVISSCLQKSWPHVSIARGGFRALHDLLRESLSTRLQNHNVRACLVCDEIRTVAKSNLSPIGEASIMDRLKGTVKVKSHEIKDKVADIVSNVYSDDKATHVKSKDRHQKRYRDVASVFSIEDEEEDVDIDSSHPNYSNQKSTSESDGVEIQFTDWIKANKMELGTSEDEYGPLCFSAQLLSTAEKVGQHKLEPCIVVVGSRQLYLLKVAGGVSGEEFATPGDCSVIIHGSHHLQDVQKITCRKQLPELITIRYASGSHSYHRLLFGRAGEFAQTLKAAIVNWQQSCSDPEI